MPKAVGRWQLAGRIKTICVYLRDLREMIFNFPADHADFRLFNHSYFSFNHSHNGIFIAGFIIE
jgi:hypothetical protein